MYCKKHAFIDIILQEMLLKEEYLEDLKVQMANTEQRMITSEEMWRREREVMKRENDNLLLEVQDLTQQRENV